ncbi:hypothetical protein [Chryseobacterium hagamense]|uniref:Uncharacterized protein n=1 Tax=Chryseobacterium hagamense TaxID=395935 RepID=A0A511YKM6_9FLAO|nr:hypothetical protein [Chryseobacterium hagamense]GEN75759.1 hypothetical protein CHA01nite_14990 [Chryseobacterium hagamense]
MEEIIQKLHQGIKQSGWDIFKHLKKELLNYNSKDLIIKLLNSKEFKYKNIRSLLVIIPELWKDFSLEDWRIIMREVNRPSNYRVFIDDGPYFEDVRFLYNWIGIDSIKLYKNDPEISDENKRYLDRVFPLFLHDTMRNGEYMEDFHDGTFGDIKFFREMKSRLMSQGAKPSPLPDL